MLKISKKYSNRMSLFSQSACERRRVKFVINTLQTLGVQILLLDDVRCITSGDIHLKRVHLLTAQYPCFLILYTRIALIFPYS